MKNQTGKTIYIENDMLTTHRELRQVKEKHDPEFFSARDHQVFDETHVLHELHHFLPSQTPLKDFIHHNALHAFQHEKFYDALFSAARIFGYQVTLRLSEFRELYKIGRIREDILDRMLAETKGLAQAQEWKERLLSRNYPEIHSPRIGFLRSHWKSLYSIDLDNLVQPLLFRVVASYLDQGISIRKFPASGGGFLDSIKMLEKNSFTSFFKGKRAKALLLEGCSIEQLLQIVVGDALFFEQYLFDQQFSHQGWSGLVAAVEREPQSLLDRKDISLKDFILFELLMEIDALDHEFGKKWKPLCSTAVGRPGKLFAPVHKTELMEVLACWQNAFEWSYYDEVLAAIQLSGQHPKSSKSITSFQALFCIDERECSLRRHIESTDPACETFGTPGFFGVEFYFQPEGGHFYDKLCPQPVTPKYLIKEFDLKEKRKHDFLYSKHGSSVVIGAVYTLTIGIWSAIRLCMNLFRPSMSPAISNAFAHMNKQSSLTVENKNSSDRENGLQVGFKIEEMAARVEGLLRGIGLTQDFAPVIYVVGHGSSSANNPHHGAHDCGACSGRPGSVNARVFAFMANHQRVREILKGKGIDIPCETQFVGCLHDTAADQMAFYDEDILQEKNQARHKQNVFLFDKALDLDAKERSRRFASINTKSNLKKVREAIRKRSVSLFEPRPELGHGTNSLCIVGERKITKNLFLDRRAFLNSYDYRTDPDGKLLTGIMKPLGPVCGGINLEYYFSRVDNYKFGAGTKLPHNVVGLFGVANSSDGDLRPGLPLQMIEVHDPVRLLIIVEHFPEVVLNTIQGVPEMYEWFINEWVHLAVLHPETKRFHVFMNGTFVPYSPAARHLDPIGDFTSFVESAKEMETNNIVDATRENLPVYLLNE